MKNHNVYLSQHTYEHAVEVSRQTDNEKIHTSSETLTKKIEKIRENVEQHASSKSEISPNKEQDTNEESNHHRSYITKKIKAETYQKTLSNVRAELSKGNQILSKVVHQPIIESVSEIGAKTVARPSGILTGGIVGFFGSILILFYAKSIGFVVPSSSFILLFLLGFSVGLLLESIWKLYIKRKYGRQKRGLTY